MPPMYLSAMDGDQTPSMEQEMAAMWAHQVETDKQIDQLLTAIARLSQLTQPPEPANTQNPILFRPLSEPVL